MVTIFGTGTINISSRNTRISSSVSSRVSNLYSANGRVTGGNYEFNQIALYFLTLYSTHICYTNTLNSQFAIVLFRAHIHHTKRRQITNFITLCE
jgi:hypothetical protein